MVLISPNVLTFIQTKYAHRIFLTLFHCFFCGFYLLVVGMAMFLDFSGVDRTNPYIMAIVDYPYAFLTNWNVVGQIFYLALSLYIDIQNLKHSDHFKSPLLIVQGYFFNAIIAPYTLFVAFMFWSLYAYDSTLVIPEGLSGVISPALNHCLHTFILIPVLVEMCFNPVYSPSHRSVIIGYTIYQAAYWVILLTILYNKGFWVYKIFEVLPPWSRLLYATANYFTGILFYFMFYYTNKFRWSFSVSEKNHLY